MHKNLNICFFYSTMKNSTHLDLEMRYLIYKVIRTELFHKKRFLERDQQIFVLRKKEIRLIYTYSYEENKNH